MNSKKIKKIAALSVAGSLLIGGAGSICASASDKKAHINLEQPGLQQNDQGNQENAYLQSHGIERAKYDEFLSLSGLNFDEMKNILEEYPDVDFDYVYKLSPITENYWAHYKQLSLTRREIFLQALDVVRTLHAKSSEVGCLKELLKYNFISLRDVDVFVRKGFSEEQKKNLTMQDFAGQISKVAAQTYNDFFRDDFKSTGYFAYGVCADLIEISGWTFDEIFDCLGNKPGILGLECLARRCQQDGKLDRFPDVVDIFKDQNSIKINDACYLCKEIVDKRGLAFGDLVNAFNEFDGWTVSACVKIADRAKESGRTYLDEIKFEYEHKESQEYKEIQKLIAVEDILD